MKVFAATTPAALLFLLIFANFSSAAAQGDSLYRLPAGTRMTIKLDAELSSGVSSVNDTFLAVLTKPVIVRDATALEKGTVLEGRVKRVERAAFAGRAGRLELTFEWLRLAKDSSRRIDAVPVKSVDARTSRTFMVLSILSGAVVGVVAGATTKSAANAGIGGAVGASAGTAIGVAKRGREAKVAKDEEFEIELKGDVVLPVLDY